MPEKARSIIEDFPPPLRLIKGGATKQSIAVNLDELEIALQCLEDAAPVLTLAPDYVYDAEILPRLRRIVDATGKLIR